MKIYRHWMGWANGGLGFMLGRRSVTVYVGPWLFDLYFPAS